VWTQKVTATRREAAADAAVEAHGERGARRGEVTRRVRKGAEIRRKAERKGPNEEAGRGEQGLLTQRGIMSLFQGLKCFDRRCRPPDR